MPFPALIYLDESQLGSFHPQVYRTLKLASSRNAEKFAILYHKLEKNAVKAAEPPAQTPPQWGRGIHSPHSAPLGAFGVSVSSASDPLVYYFRNLFLGYELMSYGENDWTPRVPSFNVTGVHRMWHCPMGTRLTFSDL